jgi:Tfp pilus assembly protein PilO
MDNVKKQNKEIKKREDVKIKKLPVKQRSAARKKLKEALKLRLDKVRKQLPSKIETPGQLKGLMSAFRTLKV